MTRRAYKFADHSEILEALAEFPSLVEVAPESSSEPDEPAE